MKHTTVFFRFLMAVAGLALCAGSAAQQHRSQAAEDAARDAQYERGRGGWRADDDDLDDKLALKIAALEALMNAPSDRAMPLVKKVLEGDQDERLQARAIFVLSQIDHPDAADMLLKIARDGAPTLREDAIRSIGIGGNDAALSGLMQVYRDGDLETRKAVLRAYLIADEDQRVFELARSATDDEEFEVAVRVLASMGATDRLRELKERAGDSEGLVRAYAIAGDVESLTEIARSDVRPDIRQRAIRAIGVTGSDEGGAILAQLYRESDDEMVRDAVLEGLMVAGDDKRLLELFRASTNDREKRRMLRMLVHMDSDAALEIIDSTLQGQD